MSERIRERMKACAAGLALLLAATSLPAAAEQVFVKYRGVLDLAPFRCQLTRSSVVHRLCYDAANRYVVVLLSNTYYHYCNVPSSVVDQWINADSLGRYFNANIKGRFDCRTAVVPEYGR